MIQNSLRTLLQANGFVFVVDVIALALALSGVLLLLLIAILRFLRVRSEAVADQKQIRANSARWALSLFLEMTTIQVAWSVGAYVVFYLLNLPPVQSRLFIIWANIIGSISAFAEGMRRLLRCRTGGRRE